MNNLTTLSDLNAAYERDSAARTFLHYIKCAALTPSRHQALEMFQQEQRLDHATFTRYEKAAATTSNSGFLEWARVSREFAALISRMTVLGQLRGTMPLIPGLSVPLLNDDVTLTFLGETDTIPAGMVTGDVVLPTVHKLGGILAISKELLRAGNDRGLSVLERHITAVARRTEDDLLLSDETATADSPAGLLEGVTAVSAGANLGERVGLLAATVRGGAAILPTFVTSFAGAVLLQAAGLLENNMIAGAPVIQSPSAGARLILIDGAAIGTVDLGLVVDTAGDATIDINGTPTSMWQLNLSAIRLIRLISWARAYDDAAGFTELPVMPGSPA